MHAPLQLKPKPKAGAPLAGARTVQPEIQPREPNRYNAEAAPFPGFGHNFSRISVYPPVANAPQAEPTLGEPGDRNEQEADREADQVMTVPEPRLRRQLEDEEQEEEPEEEVSPHLLQRQNENEEKEEEEVAPKLIQRQAAEPEEEEELEETASPSPLQRQNAGEDEEEEEVEKTVSPLAREPSLGHDFSRVSVYPQARPGQAPEVTPDTAARIQALRGGGQPLLPATRAYMEPRFGHDFSRVQVHSGSRAADTAQSVRARAFTVGRDVVFGAGQYAPGTDGGKRLLAHELTHVVQQGRRSSNSFPTRLLRKILMAGNRKWYTLWLARKWNKLNKHQRLLFVKDHFQGIKKSFKLAKRIIEDMAESSDELKFDNENELLLDVSKRLRSTELMRESQKRYWIKGKKVKGKWIKGGWGKAFNYPQEKCGPQVNADAKDYWGHAEPDPNGPYLFRLSPKGRLESYEALKRLFTPQKMYCDRTLFHCDHLASVIHLRVFSESIGRLEFNKRVQNGTIPMVLKWNGFEDIEQRAFRSSAKESLRKVTVSRREDLIIGDHVLLFNHNSYDALTEGVPASWRLENAILVDRRGGDDLFQGHGYKKPASELKMKKDMRWKYYKHVKKVKGFIGRLRSRSNYKRKKAKDGLRQYEGIKKKGSEYRIMGTGFCGTPVDEPLMTPTVEEMPGLNDPCNPGRLYPVRRPVESD